MISMSSISSAGGCAQYMTEHGATEYYAGQSVPSQWQGQGAEIQGLAGKEVSEVELTKQLEGKVQEFNKENKEWGEKQLGAMRGGEIQHRAGWDLTFSAPKSVSIQAEVFGNKDVRSAHEQAVGKAMQFLEDKAAQARIGGQFEQTKNMTYATFEHATSRAGDPQTHTHVIVSNVTYDKEGKAYSLSNEKLMEWRTTADAVYKNEMANSLEKAGYKVEWDKKGNFEIGGYSKENLETFSKRSEEIKDALAERGLDKDSASHSARQTAALSTRQDKDHPESAEAHRGRWQEEAKAAGVNQAERQTLDRNIPGFDRLQEIQAGRDAVQAALNHITEREMAFSDKDLWKEAARFAQGKTTTDEIRAAVQEQQKSGNLIERSDGKFTTRDAVNAEQRMSERLSAGQGAHESVMNSKEFDKALAAFEERKGFELSPEQRDAARMILTGDDRFQGVQGLAGTGKTTMLEFIREAAVSKGWEIKGFSNGGAQADKMQQESGIKSTTTAKHLIESDKLAKGAELAQRALDTHSKHSGVFGKEPNFKSLEKGVKDGSVKKEFVGEKAFYTDKNGDTWAKGLYDKTTQIESKNLNHLGLTSSKYVVTDKGVFKSGGGVGSELAGHLKDKLGETEKPTTLTGKVNEWAANKTLTSAQDWQKCTPIEAAAVRAQCAIETIKNRNEELSSLKTQVAQAGGENTKTLHICDEASMSGQREFNKVISATEQQGARTVFLGDEKQHQAVEAGKGFELAQNHMPMAELGKDSIRRQTTEHTKEAVSTILEGKHSEAIKGLDTKEFCSNQNMVKEKFENIENPSKQDEKAFKAELKDAAKEDNKAVVSSLAKDYSSMSREDRDKTLVITATNADRNSINNEIRDNLKAQGELQDGKKFDTLQSTGNTKEEMGRATTFEKGQVVEFTSDYKSAGVEKGDKATVTGIDSQTNTVSAKTENGQDIKFNPEKCQGKELYDVNKGKEFAVGDKVAVTKNGKDSEGSEVKNGQTGTIEKIEGNNITCKMENGEKREFDMDKFKSLDHAYAVTSYKSQGQTFDNVIVHHNTEGGRHGDREAYVDVTRAREEVTVYTQNADKAAVQSGQKMDKESATIDNNKDKQADKVAEKSQPEAKQEAVKAIEKSDQSKSDQPKEVGKSESKPEPSKAGETAQPKDTEKDNKQPQNVQEAKAGREQGTEKQEQVKDKSTMQNQESARPSESRNEASKSGEAILPKNKEIDQSKDYGKSENGNSRSSSAVQADKEMDGPGKNSTQGKAGSVKSSDTSKQTGGGNNKGGADKGTGKTSGATPKQNTPGAGASKDRDDRGR